MTRTEEEALLLWSELERGHPTMTDIELIEHHMEMAKQEVSKQQRAAGLLDAARHFRTHEECWKWSYVDICVWCEQLAKELLK